MYQNYIKQFSDYVFSFSLLIFLSPILIGLMVLLLLANKGKIFFYQDRVGKNGRFFKILKFRTMNDKKNIKGFLLPDNERLTQVGKIIRKYSLDEIPQLFNVLTGEMSLIGPRPLLPEYLPLYDQVQARRHNVKPGITGWAQINGRNSITWKEKFELDVWYVNNLSFSVDIKILVLTIGKLFLNKDVNASEQLTMEPFNGNN